MLGFGRNRGGGLGPGKEFLTKFEDQIKNAGVNIIEGYLGAPGDEVLRRYCMGS